jgi:hypothetical protein
MGNLLPWEESHRQKYTIQYHQLCDNQAYRLSWFRVNKAPMGNLLPREESQRANTLSNTVNPQIPEPGGYLGLGLRGLLWATCSLGRRVKEQIHYPIPSTL